MSGKKGCDHYLASHHYDDTLSRQAYSSPENEVFWQELQEVMISSLSAPSARPRAVVGSPVQGVFRCCGRRGKKDDATAATKREANFNPTGTVDESDTQPGGFLRNLQQLSLSQSQGNGMGMEDG